MSAQRLGRWLDVAWRGLYLVIGLATTGWGIYMGINGDEEAALALAGAGLLMLAAAVWIRSHHPVRRAVAWLGILAGIMPAAGLAVLGAWSASLANPDRPEFVVEASVYGVIGAQEGDTYLVDGEPVSQEVWDGVRLDRDRGLREGGLLLVGEADGRTYWLAVQPPSEHQIDPTCWEIDGYAWEGPTYTVIFGKDIVRTGDFHWPWEPTYVGLQLPGELSDRTWGEDRMYDGDGWTNDTVACVSRDGTVQSPQRAPVESGASPSGRGAQSATQP